MNSAASLVDAAELSRVVHLLKESRLAKNIDLKEVSEQLHLTKEQVKFLEEGNFSIFRGKVYIKGYVRAYAKLLGLDERPIIDKLEHLLPDSILDTTSAKHNSLNSDRIRVDAQKKHRVIYYSGLTLIIAVLISAIFHFKNSGYINFYHSSEQVENKSTEISSEFIQGNINIDVFDNNKVNISKHENMETVKLDSQHSAAIESVSKNNPAHNEPRLLTISFSDDCWIQIKNQNNLVEHEKLHKKGDILEVPVTGMVHLWVGKVSALSVTLDGVPLDIPVKPGYQSARVIIGESHSGDGE